MSIESMAIALHHSNAKGVARMVLLGIANHDGDGGAWPAINTLAWYAGNANRRTVQRAIKELQDLGELGKVTIMGGGTRDTPDHDRPNLYEFALTCPPNCDRTKNHRQCAVCGHPDRKAKRFVCPSCQPVDNSEAGAKPMGRSVDRPMVPRPPRGAVSAPPEPSIEAPGDESSFGSTSPERAAVCWACGQPRCINGARYCKQCINSGLNTPMIECTGCGAAGRRHTPGQQHFTCGSCRHDSPPQEAFDHEEANHQYV